VVPQKIPNDHIHVEKWLTLDRWPQLGEWTLSMLRRPFQIADLISKTEKHQCLYGAGYRMRIRRGTDEAA
jgi:hypothetical protein